MRRVALLLALAAVAALGGCARDIGPSDAELRQRWRRRISSGGLQGRSDRLPAHLPQRSTHIRGASVSQPQRKTIGPGERYVVCVRYTERNSDGRYGGPKEGVATFVRASSIVFST